MVVVGAVLMAMAVQVVPVAVAATMMEAGAGVACLRLGLIVLALGFVLEVMWLLISLSACSGRRRSLSLPS